MRKFHGYASFFNTGATLAAVVAVSMTFAATAARAADTIEVVLDQAKILQLPPNTSTIIVGNPVVADITMLRGNKQMVLTGKGYGETNMIALDAGGNAIGESVVRVTGSNHGLIVQRGATRETYSCAPRCQPTINLGDANPYMSQVISGIRTRAGASGGR